MDKNYFALTMLTMSTLLQTISESHKYPQIAAKLGGESCSSRPFSSKFPLLFRGLILGLLVPPRLHGTVESICLQNSLWDVSFPKRGVILYIFIPYVVFYVPFRRY